jgi:hypothetical protein
MNFAPKKVRKCGAQRPAKVEDNMKSTEDPSLSEIQIAIRRIQNLASARERGVTPGKGK